MACCKSSLPLRLHIPKRRMGQAIGGLAGDDTGSAHTRTVSLSGHELGNLFTKKCLAQLKQIEVFAVKANLNVSDLNQDRSIDQTEFCKLMNIPESMPRELVSLLFEFLLVLAEFPILPTGSEGEPAKRLDVAKVLRLITLLDQHRFQTIFGHDLQYEELLIAALSLAEDFEVGPASEKRSEKVVDSPAVPFDASILNNKLSWSSIDYLRDLDLDLLAVSRQNLTLFFGFCLAISTLAIEENKFARLGQFEAHFETKSWRQYEKVSNNLVRSISYAVGPSRADEKLKVVDVVRVMKSTFPAVLAPLSNLLNCLLIMPNQKDTSLYTLSAEGSKLVDQYRVAQLATFLPLEVCYSKMRKLYVGKDSGFSMRSFESRVMKWNAPTILLVKGTRIDGEKKKLSKAAETFLTEEYPRFKPSSEASPYGTGSEKLVFGVYMHQPWRASNKETFGDSSTFIFQLEPQQQLFAASVSSGKRYAYFSTLNNGGIGFGCDLPENKKGVRRFQPGNVSLLIDGGLEFCSFRHIGSGGSFQTGSAYSTAAVPEYEDKFTISDLEVYGVGSDKEIQEQLKQWEWEKKEAEARQRVNLKNLGEEKAFLEMAGLVGQSGSGGSV